jgi:hypothetical protein
MIKKSQIINEKKYIDAVGIPYLSSSDKKIIQHVIRTLKGTGAILVNSSNVGIESVVSGALGDIKEVFGSTVARRTESKLYEIDKRFLYKLPHSFTTDITYSLDSDTKKAIPSSGRVDSLNMPNVMTSADRVFIGHEFIHMNKDLNFEEYKLLMTYSDVIPILYEFITMKDDANEVLSARISALGLEIHGYELAAQKMKSGREKDLYKVILSRSGQYLNSFYYATILYRMYLNDPKMILDYIRRVINCEMTTLDMLKDLGIHLVDNNEMYDEQVQEFRGIIRK